LLDTPVSHVKVKGIFVQNINGKGRKTVMFFLGNKIIVGKFSGYSLFELLNKVFKQNNV